MLSEDQQGRESPYSVKRAKFDSRGRTLGSNVVEGMDILRGESAAGQKAEDSKNEWQDQFQKQIALYQLAAMDDADTVT